MKALQIIAVLLLCSSLAEAHLYIVNPDTTGYLGVITMTADSAQPGDSIMVRDGIYNEGTIIVDSGVVVFAEHSGGPVVICHLVTGFALHQTAQILGLQIVGDYTLTMQFLVEVYGGPATIYNCQIWPDCRQGLHLWLHSDVIPPFIRYCEFARGSGSGITNDDTNTVWMPYNYFDTTDTVIIHNFICDATDGCFGHVYVSPVLGSFQWLAAPRPRLESPQQIFFACFPNPFNPATTITFSLPHESFIKVVVFDLTGRQVRILAAQHFSAGEHRVPFDGSALSSGIYFLRMEAGAAVRTQKIVLLR